MNIYIFRIQISNYNYFNKDNHNHN